MNSSFSSGSLPQYQRKRNVIVTKIYEFPNTCDYLFNISLCIVNTRIVHVISDAKNGFCTYSLCQCQCSHRHSVNISLLPQTNVDVDGSVWMELLMDNALTLFQLRGADEDHVHSWVPRAAGPRLDASGVWRGGDAVQGHKVHPQEGLLL